MMEIFVSIASGDSSSFALSSESCITVSDMDEIVLGISYPRKREFIIFNYAFIGKCD
jgi:hypothetical protein